MPAEYQACINFPVEWFYLEEQEFADRVERMVEHMLETIWNVYDERWSSDASTR